MKKGRIVYNEKGLFTTDDFMKPEDFQIICKECGSDDVEIKHDSFSKIKIKCFTCEHEEE